MNRTVRTLSLVIASLLLLGGAVQCLIALAQIFGWTDSLNSAYPFTGTFYNPGPFGCYLAVIAPLALNAALSDKAAPRYAGMIVVFLLAALIPASGSRTGILAAGAGCALVLWDKVRTHRWPHRYRGLMVAIMAVCCAGAYLMKKDSADGRVLMWKVAAIAACDSPLTGVGRDKVAGAYGDAQERYFASAPRSAQEIRVADAPEYVFNEFLQTAIAYGAPAAALLIGLLGGSLTIAIKNKSFGFAGAITACCISMFASYPMQFSLFTLTIALIVAGGWLSSRRIPLAIGGLGTTCILCTLFLTHQRHISVIMDFEMAKIYSAGKNYQKSNIILQSILPYTSDPMPLNILGKNYRSLGMPDSAEHYFIRASHRCPNRLYPHYMLMQLYSDSASFNHESRKRQAEFIVSAPVKIQSPAVSEIKREAQKVLTPCH